VGVGVTNAKMKSTTARQGASGYDKLKQGYNPMENRTIKYYTKNVYGTDRLYLQDVKEARSFKELTQAVTISAYQMKALKELTGVEFEEVLPMKEVPV
jgi:hypothetical protein